MPTGQRQSPDAMDIDLPASCFWNRRGERRVYRLRLSRQLSRFFRMLWTQWAQTRGSQIAAHGQRSRSNHPPRAHQDWTAPFAVDEKSVESIRPNPAFRLVLESATTTEGPDDVLIRSDDTGQGGGVELGTPNQLPPGGQEADVPRSWWRRGRPRLRCTLRGNSSCCVSQWHGCHVPGGVLGSKDMC